MDERNLRNLLSVAIITLNEEERLPGCLASLSFADEVLVVDSGSTDRTREIAQSFGARVFVEPWMGFSMQKQMAVDRCSHDWVLILDADERVPEATAKTIRRVISRPDQGEVAAFSLKRKNLLHDKWIRHCGWWPDPVVRLVDRRKGEFDGRAVHERWITRGRVEHLDVHIEHLSFRNYSELVAKMERYSNIAANELFERGRRVHAFTPLFHGSWMFLRTYLLERGFLDGFDGFVISLMNAGGSFFKYAKLHELIRQKQGRNR
ncbi:MAG: glycosyltransferase family 2 protein [Deltaproteobacteria bacterium]|nr:glycosyltransferase family 2 protein [Deltaproteobacteria bacterium]MBW2017106.1 glycosyltransferase family 2 protein [Deltaproteobacteria bacterium]MBW2129870.1 glycosyltransferase family 2 protein [Deltaproteobacteria bacterium]MBW2303107.1 glycosyltransferase family 2 protein [Deltaproteobacteria bacterium]